MTNDHEIQLSETADFENETVTKQQIHKWARAVGNLPHPSAAGFATWLDTNWNDYDDGTGEQTNQDILEGALQEWTGGNRVIPTDDLKQSYAAAEQAHQDLYDENLGHDWRRGPGPIKLADFFTAVSASGVLSHLKD